MRKMGIRFGISLFFIVFLVVISHVFDKFKDILLLAAQLLRYLSFASSVSDSLLTGTLMVKSSAHFEIRLLESTSFISFTIRENKSGPKDSALRHPFININIISYFSLHDDPLFAVAKEADNPVDDVWIEISRLRLFTVCY